MQCTHVICNISHPNHITTETMYETLHHCAKMNNIAALILNYKKLASFFQRQVYMLVDLY